MDDQQIVALYWERDEQAIAESERKYGRYCHTVAYNILNDRSDAEECVNDTWVGAWNAMPPHRPMRLSVFLGKITRNLAIDRYHAAGAKKRGWRAALVFDELEECIPDISGSNPVEEIALRDALNAFLRRLPRESRVIFLQRYFYFCPIKKIAANLQIGQSKVKVTLHRVREELKQYLEQEGIVL